jgi:hypothetical protein
MMVGQDSLIELLRSQQPIEGLTHNFYRYPARFAPQFAREVIRRFSQEGDCILDAFMGGGTTVVEAIATGRKALGIDINPLAHFVTRTKTTPVSSRDREELICWAERVNLMGSEHSNMDESLFDDPRLRSVPNEVKEFLVPAASAIRELEFPRQRRLARCALVRLGQSTIDCRERIPSLNTMRTQLLGQLADMLHGLDELVAAAKSYGIAKNRITAMRGLYCGTIREASKQKRLGRLLPRAKLVLTSPPYPGVHVLYHRWQVHGRRETPAPYWLADIRDGHGGSYYTLGGRSKKGLEAYFVRLEDTFQALHDIIDPCALIVQLVGFSNPDCHLPAFLQAMRHAGYEELTPFGGSGSERPERQVPNRKWYTQLAASQYASNEILLFHRPRL